MSGIFGGGGGGGHSTQTVQQNADPWSGQQPYLKEIFAEAQNLYRGGNLAVPSYPDTTISGFAPETQQALDLQTQRALSGSPVTQAAQAEAQKTIAGDYLSAQNPYFSSMADAITRKVVPSVGAQFAGSGRYGSGLHGRATADALSEQIGNLAYQNYADERTKQLQASAMAPALAAQDYADIASLSEVGRTKEDLEQARLTETYNKWLADQTQPISALQNYQSLLSGNYGGSSTGVTSSPTAKRDVLGSSLGSAMTAAALGSMFGLTGGSLGAAAGGGALLGLFSDRRLKENIKKVGKLHNGLDVYSFNYKDSKVTQIGLMADEVKEINPEAVLRHESGFDMVMYDKAVA